MKIQHVVALFLLSAVLVCAGSALAAPPAVAATAFRQSPVAARQSAPRKPAKIKLHRTAKGEHSWDISGENAEEIVKIDRRLQKALESQEAAGEKTPAVR